MAESVVDIWNLALSAAGGRGGITSETDKGREVDLCRMHFPQVRDVIMKASSWPCSSAYALLALTATRGTASWTVNDPAPEWTYAYAEPSDMLAPRYLTSYGRFTRSRFRGTSHIMCNEPQAILHYSARETDVANWDTGLKQAVIYGLAAAITYPLSGKFSAARDNRELATEAIMLSRTEIANESDEQYKALPQWIAARGYEQRPTQTPFFWPYETFSVLGLTNASS